MIIRSNINTGGEKINPKNCFQKDCFLLDLRRDAGFSALRFLFGIALLYLNSCGDNHWAASSFFIKELAKGIFDLGINRTPFKRMFTMAEGSCY